MSARANMDHDSSSGSPQAPRTRQQPGAACDECRRRKLRCDRQKPQCGACQTSGVVCLVPATKAVRGPKRGYLKTLQTKISALEAALREHQCALPHPSEVEDMSELSMNMVDMENTGGMGDMGDMELAQLPWALTVPGGSGDGDPLPMLGVEESWFAMPHDPIETTKQDMARLGSTFRSSTETPANTYESSEGGSLDLVISSMAQSDLDQLYMDRIHMFIPIVYHGLCGAWGRLRPDAVTEAQAALRHAMWTMAASSSAYHLSLRDPLYRRTRQVLEDLDERINATIPVDTENVQAWLLLAVYELIYVGFRRAWISAGRAFRLIDLDPSWAAMEADDGTPLDHADRAHWVESEQRRRTVWFAYCLDRLISLRNGSPPTLNKRVLMPLPCPENAFQYGQPLPMGHLPDVKAAIAAMAAMGSTESSYSSSSYTIQNTMFPTSPFGECIILATVAEHALSHRLQASADSSTKIMMMATTTNTDSRDILTQETTHTARDDFWGRHAWLESLVAQGIEAFALLHPPSAQESDPMLMFLAIMWHTMVLYLWNTAESLPASAQDRDRAVCATTQQVDRVAHDMLHLMSRLSELNSWKMHPLINIPLALCGELLVPRPDLMEIFAQKLKDITQAAHGLRIFSSHGPRT